jgi:tryptophan halogenase
MRRVASVVVVGGGSAGWMTAAYLSRRLLGVRVTVIESDKIPTIGVGEATTPRINHFLGALGFTSHESWMPICNATFKTGIKFEDWFERGDWYWHPFDSLDYFDDHHHVGHYWLAEQAKHGRRDRSSFYEEFFSSTTVNVAQNRMPHHREIAYHFDAAAFGRLLRTAARDVTLLVDEVLGVELDEQGGIAALSTAAHGRVAADLFVDCTGFHRQLIGRVAPDQRFESYSDSLLNDRAVVTRMHWDPDIDLERQVFPYVKASARSAGWIWSIPLYDRLSCGYVYSSRFISDDEATKELEQHCGRGWDRGVTLFNVRFMTGKLSHLWVKNCVAIGLSGGFIEPLESSGLAITQMGVELLASVLDARYYDAPDVERYNAAMGKCYTDIIHFIIAHYCLTSRDDTPYWAAVKHEAVIPPGLQARFDVFKRYLPTAATKALADLTWAFRELSWFCVLLGMNFEFDVPELPEAMIRAGAELVRERRRLTDELSARLPNHYRFLESQIYRRPAKSPR